MYAYTKMLFVALTAAVMLTGCDSDTSLAMDLDGVWQGEILGNYYSYRRGSNDYDTEIMFRQNGVFSNGGTGYEIDRNFATGRYTKNYFDWSVNGGRIYLHYDDGYRVIIRDYDTYWMGGRLRFRGYFDNYDTGEQMASFNLVKVESSSDYYDRYYQMQESGELTADSTRVIKKEE